MIPASRKIVWEFAKPTYGQYLDKLDSCLMCDKESCSGTKIRIFRPGDPRLPICTMDTIICDECATKHAKIDSIFIESKINWELQLKEPDGSCNLDGHTRVR